MITYGLPPAAAAAAAAAADAFGLKLGVPAAAAAALGFERPAAAAAAAEMEKKKCFKDITSIELNIPTTPFLRILSDSIVLCIRRLSNEYFAFLQS